MNRNYIYLYIKLLRNISTQNSIRLQSKLSELYHHENLDVTILKQVILIRFVTMSNSRVMEHHEYFNHLSKQRKNPASLDEFQLKYTETLWNDGPTNPSLSSVCICIPRPHYTTPPPPDTCTEAQHCPRKTTTAKKWVKFWETFNAILTEKWNLKPDPTHLGET